MLAVVPHGSAPSISEISHTVCNKRSRTELLSFLVLFGFFRQAQTLFISRSRPVLIGFRRLQSDADGPVWE